MESQGAPIYSGQPAIRPFPLESSPHSPLISSSHLYLGSYAVPHFQDFQQKFGMLIYMLHVLSVPSSLIWSLQYLAATCSASYCYVLGALNLSSSLWQTTTPWLKYASKLYRPSDRRLSAKLVPMMAISYLSSVALNTVRISGMVNGRYLRHAPCTNSVLPVV
jgi:hypothetical protein